VYLSEPNLSDLLKGGKSSNKGGNGGSDNREAAVKRKIDGQITEYTKGSGEGIDDVRLMLQSDPDNVDLLDWLAFMLYTNNSLDEAIELYKKLLALNHRPDNQHFYLGNAYFKKGLAKLAIESWKKVMELAPDSKLARKAKVRIEQAG